jgi:hypothetical protein
MNGVPEFAGDQLPNGETHEGAPTFDPCAILAMDLANNYECSGDSKYKQPYGQPLTLPNKIGDGHVLHQDGRVQSGPKLQSGPDRGVPALVRRGPNPSNPAPECGTRAPECGTRGTRASPTLPTSSPTFGAVSSTFTTSSSTLVTQGRARFAGPVLLRSSPCPAVAAAFRPAGAHPARVPMCRPMIRNKAPGIAHSSYSRPPTPPPRRSASRHRPTHRRGQQTRGRHRQTQRRRGPTHRRGRPTQRRHRPTRRRRGCGRANTPAPGAKVGGGLVGGAAHDLDDLFAVVADGV